MTPLDKVRDLPIWRGRITAVPLDGGITNVNVLVTDGDRRAVVRIGDDIPVHQIMRFNELAASRAAHAAGVSPAVLYHEPGALVIDFIEGRTLTAADLQDDAAAGPGAGAGDARASRHSAPPARPGADLLGVPRHARLCRHAARRAQPAPAAAARPAGRGRASWKRAVGPVDLVFGHNDLLPANFLHDGTRHVADRLGLCRLQLAAVRPGRAGRQQRPVARRRKRGCWTAYFDRAARRRALAPLPRDEGGCGAARDAVVAWCRRSIPNWTSTMPPIPRTNLATYRAALAAFQNKAEDP